MADTSDEMIEERHHRLAELPQIDMLLRHRDAIEAVELYGRDAFAVAARTEVAAARQAIGDGRPAPSPAQIVSAVSRRLRARRDAGLQRVINATGVVLHTNLGRAPLSSDARRAVYDATGYTTLEYDLATGARGSRTTHIGDVAAELCGTEAATVVNNGAAALVLVLAALAFGREVIVSRGELIEIGGSFRLPEMMVAAGCELVEVGSTNRTRAEDYRAAINERTALLLKVHHSNFEMRGFTEEASVAALAELGRRHDLPFVHDLGSGLLRTTTRGPLAQEPAVESSVTAGSDLVIFSGDKLLGGPQAGIVAGRRDLIDRCRRHPLARAVRIDKLQRAALEATFTAHLRSAEPVEVPTVAMLTAEPASLRTRAEQLAVRLGTGAAARPVEGVVGGGSLPGATLSSWAVALDGPDPDAVTGRLRSGRPPVVARIDGGVVLLDLRTVPADQDDELGALVDEAWTSLRPSR